MQVIARNTLNPPLTMTGGGLNLFPANQVIILWRRFLDQKTAPDTGKMSGKADDKHEVHGHDTGHETQPQEHHKLFDGGHKHPVKETHANHKIEEKLKDLQKQLDDTEKKYEEMLDTARRVKAEYENFKKRSDAMFLERVDLEKMKVLLEFLPSYDNLERALAAVNKDPKSEDLTHGVEMIAKQFKASLDRLGVTEIADKDCEFNPEIHEAVSMHENPDIKCETVTEVFEKGYQLNGRIIRHAKVVVDIPTRPDGCKDTEKSKEPNQSPGSQEQGTEGNSKEKKSGGENG
jgi:molecular chaperone GrpE